MGMEAEVLSEDEKEDIGLLKAMLEGRKGDYVSEDEVLKVLREKWNSFTNERSWKM